MVGGWVGAGVGSCIGSRKGNVGENEMCRTGARLRGQQRKYDGRQFDEPFLEEKAWALIWP